MQIVLWTFTRLGKNKSLDDYKYEYFIIGKRKKLLGSFQIPKGTNEQKTQAKTLKE